MDDIISTGIRYSYDGSSLTEEVIDHFDCDSNSVIRGDNLEVGGG